MKKKATLILIAMLLIFVLGTQAGFSKEKAETDFDAARVIGKLDQVLTNQAEILEQFEQIKQELAVIKIRATR